MAGPNKYIEPWYGPVDYGVRCAWCERPPEPEPNPPPPLIPPPSQTQGKIHCATAICDLGTEVRCKSLGDLLGKKTETCPACAAAE